MRTVLDARTFSRYGARSRGGIHTVLDVETALAAADTAARLQDRLAAGERLSGPAARRALTAAAHIPRFEGRIVPRTFVHKARAYLARDGIVLYDNPEALLICAFKHDVAMCEPDPSAMPLHPGSTTAAPAVRTPSAPTATPSCSANAPANSTSSPAICLYPLPAACGPTPPACASPLTPTTPPPRPPRSTPSASGSRGSPLPQQCSHTTKTNRNRP